MATKKQTEKLIALFVSIVLGPPVWLVTAGIAVSWFYRIPWYELLIIFSPMLIPVVSYVLFVVLISKTTDYEFTNVKTRRPILLIALGGLLLSMILVLRHAPVLAPLTVSMLIILAVTTAITFYWKISFHALLFTTSVLLLAKLVNPLFLVFLALLPLLYWSRIKLKKHELAQLILGTISSVIILI